MALVEAVSGVLQREITADEVEMLQLLSPQGVAKVNTDLSQGVDPEHTLSQLRFVLRATRHRQTLVESVLPRELAPVVAQMSRPLTVDELVLLSEGSFAAALERKITLRTQQGELLEDVLEELAERHRHKVLREEAKLLSEQVDKPVTVSPLSPTKLTAANAAVLTMSVTTMPGKTGRLRLGPGPLLTWFAPQLAAQDHSECPSVCTVSSQDSAPRSALKRGTSVGPSCGSTSSIPYAPSSPRSVGPEAPGVEDRSTAPAVAHRVSFATTSKHGDYPRTLTRVRARSLIGQFMEVFRHPSGLSDRKPRSSAALQKLKRLLSCHQRAPETELRPVGPL